VIGERVRLAREACRLTQQQLAEAAGISQGTLSDLEAGRVLRPAEATIEKIANATHYPPPFFHLGPIPDLPVGHYRKLAKGSSKVGKQVRAQVQQVVELVERAEKSLKLPVAIHPIQELAGIEDVENIAQQTRSSLGLHPDGPVPNVIRAVERGGIVVVRLPGDMEDHFAFSSWPDYGFGGRPIIALMAGGSGDRDRMSASHELGHLVLHTLRASTNRSEAEPEAFRFAGAFLLPRVSAKTALRPPLTLSVLMGVKATYGLSIAASAKRAFDLNIISNAQFSSIHKQLSARKWKRQEPVEVPQEQPALIGQVIQHLAATGTTSQRADRLSLPVFALRSMELA
jgi:Zn-dependent peptidase ImmA (M78 family)/DNA-binding XRE family transcriptional regulator